MYASWDESIDSVSATEPKPPLDPGKLAENVIEFARVLRRAGLRVGSGAVLDALSALEVTPFTSRDDFRAVLHAIFVKSHDQSGIFDQAFGRFWARRGLTDGGGAVSGASRSAGKARPPAGATRVAEALFARRDGAAIPPRVNEVDAAVSTSADEVLQAKDFAQMNAAEVAEAVAAIGRMRLPRDELPTRRFTPDARGSRIDARRSFRRSMRGGGAGIELARHAPVLRKPPVVAICDISGSMADYSRVFLHFLHALSAQRRVHSFLFGTRLTNVSRVLARKDVDEALAGCADAVRDWSGGTRIGASLHVFNKLWLRRVAAQASMVILFTDGLERGAAGELGVELARLQRSCRRLIWLNPLLRYEAFEAKALGIRTMLPFVDEFRPVHNLRSVADLCLSLGRERSVDGDPTVWLAESA